MITEGIKEEYTQEVYSIIDEYNRLRNDYVKVNNEIKDLQEKIKELEVREHELSVDLALNKEREKTFFGVLQEKDYKSYVLIKENIKNIIEQKIKMK